MSQHRHLAIAAVCALLAGLPFLNKAFTIDDTPVLTVAQQITVDPLRPFSCELIRVYEVGPARRHEEERIATKRHKKARKETQ